ncbi:MAG: trypsin-like serine protease, partial [Proteobacteria bacterium]|nr:trypsin-like serine protease [Pseudomonadota bacterium]
MKPFLMAAAAAALVPMAASAATSLTYQAAPDIVGQTSTATIASGGNPIYAATAPQYSGVVALIMNEGAAGNFICSGALLPDRRSILTAGHCVSHGAGTANPISTTAYFYNGGNPDQVVPLSAAATAVAVSKYIVNPLYTGQVIDENDIAVVQLAQAAPAFAQSYGLYAGNPVGQDYNVAGYGMRSDVGGSVGADLGTGRLRQGDNRYDFTLGDPAFGGFFDPSGGFFGSADNSHVLLADFDNGLSANDASCLLLTAGFGEAPNSQFCNTGLGDLEVSTAPGDSGGPQFINGQIASVTSFGLTFGTDFGDIDGNLNDTFGEFNGFTPVGTHLDFINDAMVPEPAAWALMLLGFGV